MKSKNFLLLLPMFCVAVATQAQPTAAEWAAHKAEDSIRFARLDSIIGAKNFLNGPQINCPQLEANRPTWEFKNGSYSLDYTIKQVQCGTNDIAAHVDEAERKVVAVGSKLPPNNRTVQEYVNSAIASLPPMTAIHDTIRLTVSGAPLGSGTGPDGSVYMYPDGMLQLRANSRHLPSQGGITSEYCGQVALNGYDGGLRQTQNRKDNSEQTCAPMLQWGYWGPDSRMTWSYAQYPSVNTASSVGSNETFGQSFIIDGGFGQIGYSFGGTSPLPRGVLLAAQRGAQSLMLGVSPERQLGGTVDYPTNRVGLYIDAKTPVGGNPVVVWADGTYRRVKTCNINGVVVFCAQ